MPANLYALAAVALWAALASLGVLLAHVPPFLLTGIALMTGGLLAVPAALRDHSLWRVAPRTLALGVLTLFGFHFLLFIGLRLAPAVEVNLVNYLWPLFIVVLAPLYVPGLRLRGTHVLAALLGFAGAAVAILGARQASAALALEGRAALGYGLALGSALIWANYSLQTKRLALAGRGFATAAVGLFGLVSGALSLLCHWLLEPAADLSWRDAGLLLALGLGPLGGAFYLWDRALKLGDPRHIGLLSYGTPLASTALLLLTSGRDWSASLGVAALLIVGAGLIGLRSR
ncbi:MAG: EamA family transporter [Polaromonas sp.]|nr:EamA family transporter [Polaromonas sp.]